VRIVLDANRLFSALLRDGSTRRTLYDTSATLFAPAFLKAELEKHRAELQRRSGLSVEDLGRLVEEIFAQVEWVPDEIIGPHVPAALAALGAVDPDDVPYLAAALAVEADAIWSEDKGFDEQSLVPRTRHPDRVGANP